MATQVDWTGEQGGINPNLVLCANPKCSKPLRNSKEDSHYGRSAGRPATYCSDACKMKAYRKRKKALPKCLTCGSSIIQGQTRLRKYCSNSCKQIGYRNTQKLKGFRLLHGRHFSQKSVFSDDSRYAGEAGIIAVFGETQLYKKTTGVGSVCNTHTKQWKPTVNDKNKAV